MKSNKWLMRVLCFILISVANTTQAAWLEIDNSYRDEITYIDSGRIRKEGVKAFYWTMTTYKQPQLLLGKSAMSLLNQNVVDCKRQVQATLSFAWYEGPNATGESINTMNIQETQLEFHPIVPNSIGDKQAKFACTTSSPQP